MGVIVVEQIVSVDAFAATADGGIDFFGSAGDFSETEPEQLERLGKVDAILLGATTYRMFASYWPAPIRQWNGSPNRLTRYPNTSFPRPLRTRRGVRLRRPPWNAEPLPTS